MFKLFRLKLEKELAETKLIYEIEIKKKDAERKILEDSLRADHQLKLTEAVTLLRLDSEQKNKQLELSFQRKMDEFQRGKEQEFLKLKEGLLSDNHNKFNEVISNIHEKGNLTTKFVQELAVKMMEKAPPMRIETKSISATEK